MSHDTHAATKSSVVTDQQDSDVDAIDAIDDDLDDMDFLLDEIENRIAPLA